MYTPDLATHCMAARGNAVRAIGWLEAGQPFSTFDVDPRLVSALRAHMGDPVRWLPAVTAGIHFCDLGGCDRSTGKQYMIVPSRTCVYIAPDLVVHYVEQHRYAPPAEFVDAMLACPEPSSAAYFDLLLPFADIWRLTPDDIRRIAADDPDRRKAHAEMVAQEEEARKGGFKW